MSLDISDEEFRKIFADESLYLPIRWNGNNFLKSLEELYYKYQRVLKDTNVSFNVSSNSYQLNCSIKEVCNLILKSLKQYLNGFPADAYDIFSELMSYLIKTPLWIYQKSCLGPEANIRDDLNLFRVKCLANCSGCGVCAAVCPTHCITMTLNNDGFYKPLKAEDNCVHCTLCDGVCPFKSGEAVPLDSMSLYSANAIDNSVCKQSSSGGIAWLIADYAIEHGYAVCGVIYNYETHRAEHKVFYNRKGLEQLKGSKYLQSYTQGAFCEIMKTLKEDPDKKFVVFGTPCQIAGLDTVLKRKKFKDRVILIDIFCHGVPSYLLWRKYWTWLDAKHEIKEEKVMKLTFRDKQYSWHKYFMHVICETPVLPLKNAGGGITRIHCRGG